VPHLRDGLIVAKVGFVDGIRIGMGLYLQLKSIREAQREATDFIAFVVPVVFFQRFQPKKRMSSP
jgi:hypothetical protein